MNETIAIHRLDLEIVGLISGLVSQKREPVPPQPDPRPPPANVDRAFWTATLFDPVDVARQLSLLELDLLMAITSKELMSCEWTVPERKAAPRIVAETEFRSRVCVRSRGARGAHFFLC